jgi:hypothetical protein
MARALDIFKDLSQRSISYDMGFLPDESIVGLITKEI